MRLTRLALRNYRVYEEPLELELPAGLVGIYGPNGAGKSALVESIRFALWGTARTTKADVRTAGVNGECMAEVEFEHEGHLYSVRRTLNGVNANPRADARADGAQVAEGVRDVARYVQSVLGVDDAAFRASVFTEQKQLAAFSAHAPEKRRELVLRLLGITPLDRARDDARVDARAAASDHDRLRAVLPDLDGLREAVASAEEAVAAARQAAMTAEAAEEAARRRRDEAEGEAQRVDELRRAHDELVAEGRAAKAELDAASAVVTKLDADLAELASADAELATLRPQADGLIEAEATLRRVEAVVAAEETLAKLPDGESPPPPDDAATAAVVERARAESADLVAVAARLEAATGELDRARTAAERSEALSGEGDCPLCGQVLGEAFTAVVAHRQADLAEAEARVAELRAQRDDADRAAQEAEAAAHERVRSDEAARRAVEAWARQRERRVAAEEALAEARASLGRPFDADEARVLAEEVAARRAAADRCRRLEGRLERRPAAERDRREAQARADDAAARRQVLLDKVCSLGFRIEQADAALAELKAARRAAEAATAAAHESRLAAAQAAGATDAARQRLVDGQDQHDRIAEVAESSRHLGRLADLLGSFRNAVVATVGPRLASQAAELFAELTDREYDRLDVDPDTYGLQIVDAGRPYGIDRFSGSETDLANLALRVAISEHVRFQSGGAVGLLVLDEVFGPLDDDRKARMLLALERLRSRFRQVLVVTHANDIKDQLPSAIEVVKLPGRRATARVLAGV